MTCHSAYTSPLRLNRRSAFRRALRRCGGALFAALAVAVPLTCGAADAAPSDPEPPKLTIFAAASLKTALDEIAEAWRDRTGGALALSYAGSSALARQIEQGAPADLFVSANAAWMDRLDAAGLLREGSRRDVAGNALVLVAHRDGADPAGDSAGDPAPETLAPGADLVARLDGGRLAMALVDAVPAGIYGRQALTSLGIWEATAPHVAQTDNVRAALALVATGEAPRGVVYATDATPEPRVRIAGVFPAGAHDPIVYPAAAVADPAATPETVDAALAFLDFLSGPEARAALTRQGFALPD